MPPLDFLRDRPIFIETLRPAFAARYEELGLVFASPEVAGSTDIILRLRRALRWLASAPSLAAAVGAVLEVLHVAVPEEADFDVSYSDPEAPFSVFVGVGAGTGATASLRLAEALLHESMHLQLTQIEHHLPLVAPGETRLHSPWQNTMRPTQGVLHGTYVFAVIRDFMIALRDGGLAGAEERFHVDARIATCTKEIATAVASLGGIADLTSAGRDLVARIASRLSS